MTQVRKVPLNAGAEWLMGGFALLRRAPLALGLLGLIWGGFSGLASITGQLWLSLVLALLGPILFAGVVYAAREVDRGRAVSPAYLLQGLRDGKAVRLLAMLLPQLIAILVMALLLVVMIGGEQMQHIVKVMEQMQTNPDPKLAESLPAGRMFAWLVLVVVVGVVAGFFTFVAIPDVMFTQRGAFEAMGLSFRSCLRNLGALVVMFVLLLIAMVAISIAVNLIVIVLAWAVGQQAAVFAGQLLLMAVVVPVMGGLVYYAWRQMLGENPAATVQSTAGGIEV
jgi:hypothetical protein